MKQTAGFTGKKTFYFLFYSSEESHMSYRSWRSYRNDWTLTVAKIISKKHLKGWRHDRRTSSVVVASLRLCCVRARVGEDVRLRSGHCAVCLGDNGTEHIALWWPVCDCWCVPADCWHQFLAVRRGHLSPEVTHLAGQQEAVTHSLNSTVGSTLVVHLSDSTSASFVAALRHTAAADWRCLDLCFGLFPNESNDSFEFFSRVQKIFLSYFLINIDRYLSLVLTCLSVLLPLLWQ